MLLKKTSEECKTFFLKEFTKELVNHSSSKDVELLRKSLREKIKENIEKKRDREKFNEMVKQEK